MPPKQKAVSSGVAPGKGKGKRKGKRKARRVNGAAAAVASSTEDGAAVPALDNKRGTMTEKDAAGACCSKFVQGYLLRCCTSRRMFGEHTRWEV